MGKTIFVPVVPPLSGNQIEQQANKIVSMYPDAWAGKEPVPVDFIFDHDIKALGIKPLFTDLSVQGRDAYGFTDGINKSSMISDAVANDTSVVGRRFFRSTVGHELGHVYLHVPYGQFHASLQAAGIGFMRERSNMRAWEDPEWQAWRFCKALCMPAHLVHSIVKKFGTNQQGIDALKEAFDMNYSFVMSRIRELQILPR